MHIYTPSQAGVEGQDRLDLEADGMGDTTAWSATPEAARRPRIAKDTIVVWTTDNGAEVFSWPDGGTTPFHGEKNTSWEGGYRPSRRDALAGRDQRAPRSTTSCRTRLGADAGIGGRRSESERQTADRPSAAGKSVQGPLDGYDQRDLLASTGPSKRKEFFLLTDDGNLAAIRYERWEDALHGATGRRPSVWQDPLVTLRFPEAHRLARRSLRDRPA